MENSHPQPAQLAFRPQTPRPKRPLSIAYPSTPSTPVSERHLLQWRASDLLSRIDQDALIKLTPKIAGSYCELDSTPVIRSYMNVLIVLHDVESGKRWVARVPYDQEDRSFLVACVQPLKCVIKKFNGFRRPRLYHFALATDPNNTVGVDFMLLDFIEGVQLCMFDSVDPELKHRHKILNKVADVMLELLTKPVTEQDGIKYLGVPGCDHSTQRCSAAVWLYESIDRGIRKSLQDHDLPTAINYLIMRSQVPKYIVHTHDEDPWYIAHSDLHNRNIIVDEDMNLQGVIDWDDAYAVPLQKAAVWPKLLEFVPGDEFPDLPDDYIAPDLSKDKEYFLSVFRDRERIATGQTYLAQLIETSSERNFFELAHHRMRVHAEWVQRYCQRTPDNVRAASLSLHAFLNLEWNLKWLEAGGFQSGLGAEDRQGKVSMWSMVELSYEFDRLEMEASFEEYLANMIIGE